MSEFYLRLDVRLLVVAKRLDGLGGWIVPATGLDVVLGDGEVDAIGVKARDRALGDGVLVWESSPSRARRSRLGRFPR
jgi:hypothetical protein